MTERQHCTEETPKPVNAPGQWVHTRVEEVGEQEDGWRGGDVQRHRCLNCGVTWKAELPQ